MYHCRDIIWVNIFRADMLCVGYCIKKLIGELGQLCKKGCHGGKKVVRRVTKVSDPQDRSEKQDNFSDRRPPASNIHSREM